MAISASPFAEEELFSGGSVAGHIALCCWAIQRMDQGGKGVQLVGRQIEWRHSSSRNSFADHVPELLNRTLAQATIACKSRASIAASSVHSVTPAATRDETLVGVHDEGSSGKQISCPKDRSPKKNCQN